MLLTDGLCHIHLRDITVRHLFIHYKLRIVSLKNIGSQICIPLEMGPAEKLCALRHTSNVPGYLVVTS